MLYLRKLSGFSIKVKVYFQKIACEHELGIKSGSPQKQAPKFLWNWHFLGPPPPPPSSNGDCILLMSGTEIIDFC